MRAGREWRRWIAAGVVTALVGGMLVGAFGAIGGGDDDSGGDDGSQDALNELASRLQQGRNVTYEASYTATLPQVSGTVRLQVARRPPLARHTIMGSPGDEVRTFFLEGGPVRCRLQTPQPWKCEPQSGETTGEVDTVVAAFVAQLKGEVEASDEEIAGRDARCFDGEGEVRVCVSSDGIVLLAEAATSRMELVELRHTVADDAFRLPTAEPSPVSQ